MWYDWAGGAKWLGESVDEGVAKYWVVDEDDEEEDDDMADAPSFSEAHSHSGSAWASCIAASRLILRR